MIRSQAYNISAPIPHMRPLLSTVVAHLSHSPSTHQTASIRGIIKNNFEAIIYHLNTFWVCCLCQTQVCDCIFIFLTCIIAISRTLELPLLELRFFICLPLGDRNCYLVLPMIGRVQRIPHHISSCIEYIKFTQLVQLVFGREGSHIHFSTQFQFLPQTLWFLSWDLSSSTQLSITHNQEEAVAGQ